MSFRFLLVDDHEIVRPGLRAALEQQDGWRVCGEATDGQSALAKLSELSPDIVILDVSMPVLNGFETAKQIRQIAPSTKVILVSVHDIPASAKTVGAHAFVQKGRGFKVLFDAIERVISRER